MCGTVDTLYRLVPHGVVIFLRNTIMKLLTQKKKYSVIYCISVLGIRGLFTSSTAMYEHVSPKLGSQK